MVTGEDTAITWGAVVSRVRTTLSLARLLPLFDVYDDEQEALRQFAAP